MTRSELEVARLYARYDLEHIQTCMNEMEYNLFHYPQDRDENRRIQRHLVKKKERANNKLNKLMARIR